MVHFGEFLQTWSLRSNSVTRQVSFNRTKIGGKCPNQKNLSATFWVIFKQYVAPSKFNLKNLSSFFLVLQIISFYEIIWSNPDSGIKKGKRVKNYHLLLKEVVLRPIFQKGETITHFTSFFLKTFFWDFFLLPFVILKR